MASRKFEELEAKMPQEARQRAAELTRQMNMEILLEEVRQQAEMTQAELAQAMGISQPNVSKLEGEDDMRISTLRRIVKALGGTLRISVEVPGKGEFTLTQFAGPK